MSDEKHVTGVMAMAFFFFLVVAVGGLIGALRADDNAHELKIKMLEKGCPE